MSIMKWRPMDEMFSLRKEMDRLLGDFFGGDLARRGEDWGGWVPPVNVSESGNEIIVTVEVPGMDAKDMDISLQDNTLTIKGEKKREKEEKGENYHRLERSYGSFTRQVTLPCQVLSEKTAADYKNGVLRITMPKVEGAKRKTIKVTDKSS